MRTASPAAFAAAWARGSSRAERTKTRLSGGVPSLKTRPRKDAAAANSSSGVAAGKRSVRGHRDRHGPCPMSSSPSTSRGFLEAADRRSVNLVRGAIIDREGGRAPAHVDTEPAHEKGCWKMRCPRSPAKNSASDGQVRSPTGTSVQRRRILRLSTTTCVNGFFLGGIVAVTAAKMPDGVVNPLGEALPTAANTVSRVACHRGVLAPHARNLYIASGVSICQASMTCVHSEKKTVG